MSASKKSLLRPDPSLINELKSIYQFGRIVGLDEVGRGALAGPIVVAAIEINVVLPNVCDSKRLSVVSRTELTPLLIANATQVSLGQASNDEIDSIGITQAQELAYARALENINADLFLTDFVRLPKKYKTIRAVKGDSLFYPVAAASIIAKTYRDQLMKSYGRFFPQYYWQTNVGYSTANHKRKIDEIGPSPLHRKTYLNWLKT